MAIHDAAGVQSLTVGATLGDAARATAAYLRGIAHPERFVRELLERAGVEVGGPAAHDLVVRDRRFYARVARDGALGLGETYVEGWWASPAVDQMIPRIHRARLPEVVRKNWRYLLNVLRARLFNLQS